MGVRLRVALDPVGATARQTFAVPSAHLPGGSPLSLDWPASRRSSCRMGKRSLTACQGFEPTLESTTWAHGYAQTQIGGSRRQERSRLDNNRTPDNTQYHCPGSVDRLSNVSQTRPIVSRVARSYVNAGPGRRKEARAMSRTVTIPVTTVATEANRATAASAAVVAGTVSATRNATRATFHKRSRPTVRARASACPRAGPHLRGQRHRKLRARNDSLPSSLDDPRASRGRRHALKRLRSDGDGRPFGADHSVILAPAGTGQTRTTVHPAPTFTPETGAK